MPRIIASGICALCSNKNCYGQGCKISLPPQDYYLREVTFFDSIKIINREKIMFEVASRLKVRFNYKGLCTVEDLWDLPLTALDKIYKELNASLKGAQEDSLLEVKTSKNEELELKVNLIKYIVSTRLKEQSDRENARERSMQKQKILKIMSEKEDAKLQSKSLEELDAMAKELD